MERESERDGETQRKEMSWYEDGIERLRKGFSSGRTRSLEFRTSELTSLIRLLSENEDFICEALHKDLRKCKFETMVSEIKFTKNEAIYALNNLRGWTEPESVVKPFAMKLDQCFIQKQPLGLVLIIGAWNYPLQLTLTPLIGAISAGNCAIIKPSEISPHTSDLLVRLLPKYLDKECFAVIPGGPDETSYLLTFPFDKIFFTGSPAIGRLVLKAAAEHLTPVTLELGGKNPCYVDGDCDPDSVAQRVAWGRFLNAGQTCVAPDYLLCSPATQEALLPALARALERFFGPEPQLSPDYGRLATRRHFARLRELLREGRAAIGGQSLEEELYIAPTVLVDVSRTDRVMEEEIFGPILPILTVESVDDAIRFINSRTKPLALYVYSRDTAVVKEFLDNTTSGSFCANDNVVQMTVQTLPFGGVGESGTGSYHGKFSFDTFSHSRACVLKHEGMERVNTVRYPPYDDSKLGLIQWATEVKKREGLCRLM